MANLASQREYRQRASSRDLRREQQAKRAGEQQPAVHGEHEIAISAERNEAGWQQQEDGKSQRDQQAHADRSIDHHADDGVAPIAAASSKQPGTYAVTRHARQHLSEEHANGGHADHDGPRHPFVSRRQRVNDVGPSQSPERDLQHHHQHGECGPAKIQQRNGGYDLTQIDLPREIPEARPGHEQLGGKDRNFSGAATARRSSSCQDRLPRWCSSDFGFRSQPSRPQRWPTRVLGRALSAMVMAERNGKFKRRIGEASRRPRAANGCGCRIRDRSRRALR